MHITISLEYFVSIGLKKKLVNIRVAVVPRILSTIYKSLRNYWGLSLSMGSMQILKRFYRMVIP